MMESLGGIEGSIDEGSATWCPPKNVVYRPKMGTLMLDGSPTQHQNRSGCWAKPGNMNLDVILNKVQSPHRGSKNDYLRNRNDWRSRLGKSSSTNVQPHPLNNIDLIRPEAVQLDENSLNRSLKGLEKNAGEFGKILGPGGICSPIRRDVRNSVGINGLSPWEQPSRFSTEQFSPGG